MREQANKSPEENKRIGMVYKLLPIILLHSALIYAVMLGMLPLSIEAASLTFFGSGGAYLVYFLLIVVDLRAARAMSIGSARRLCRRARVPVSSASFSHE